MTDRTEHADTRRLERLWQLLSDSGTPALPWKEIDALRSPVGWRDWIDRRIFEEEPTDD